MQVGSFQAVCLGYLSGATEGRDESQMCRWAIFRRWVWVIFPGRLVGRQAAIKEGIHAAMCSEQGGLSTSLRQEGQRGHLRGGCVFPHMHHARCEWWLLGHNRFVRGHEV